jgi:aldose sugar dehydrogenase
MILLRNKELEVFKVGNIERDLKVPNTEQNAQKCLCPECPVYNECMEEKDELFFCARGKATCEFEKWGCKCAKCQIESEYNLVGLFYCEKGAVRK